jgi:hypothetical protein
VFSANRGAKEDIFIVDSGASIYIFKEKQNKNIGRWNSSNRTIQGIGGKRIEATFEGDMEGLRKFLIVPQVRTNLLSVAELVKTI